MDNGSQVILKQFIDYETGSITEIELDLFEQGKEIVIFNYTKTNGVEMWFLILFYFTENYATFHYKTSISDEFIDCEYNRASNQITNTEDCNTFHPTIIAYIDYTIDTLAELEITLEDLSLPLNYIEVYEKLKK